MHHFCNPTAIILMQRDWELVSGKIPRKKSGPVKQGVAGPITGSQIQLPQLIDFLPDPTFAVDRMGSVIAWNKAMETLTGVNVTRMLGKKNPVYSKIFYGTVRPMLVDLILHETKKPRKDMPISSEAVMPSLPGWISNHPAGL